MAAAESDIACIGALRTADAGFALTEPGEHLAGSLGAAIASEMVRRRWVARRSGTRAARSPPTDDAP
jgi:hypothetical protein